MEFRVLGPLEVYVGGRPLEPGTAKERALLAILLLHANELVPAERLIDQLWGGEPPRSAQHLVHVYVSQLRKTLRAAKRDVLLTRPPGYVLRVDQDALDLSRFERLLREARRAFDGGDPASASRTLEDALALWRGPALADVAYESFAQPAIARLDELRAAAVELRIEADLALGRHAELVADLEALVAADPLRERLRGQLMLALYRSGRQAEALTAYIEARRVLVEGLGIEPGSQLKELQQAILRQDPRLDLAPTPEKVRSILVAALVEERLDALVAVAEPLARNPRRELILSRLVMESADLAPAAASVHERREALLRQEIFARAAVFASASPGDNLVRLATEQDVDLLLVDAPPRLLDDPTLQAILSGAPCDVAVLVVRHAAIGGPVLVPFAGGEHDWAAAELGAWFAIAHGAPLRLAGPAEEGRDVSRLLASASLAIQAALGVAAEPLLVAPGAEEIVRAADEASIVLVGLSSRWRQDGLGRVRSALAVNTRRPTLLVRSGLRPGGLAPPESRTRFTWSLAPAVT